MFYSYTKNNMWQIYCCIRVTCVKREKKGAIYMYHLDWKCCIIHFMSLLKQNRSLFYFLYNHRENGDNGNSKITNPSRIWQTKKKKKHNQNWTIFFLSKLRGDWNESKFENNYLTTKSRLKRGHRRQPQYKCWNL